jgi:putative ABC transport system permease protein
VIGYELWRSGFSSDPAVLGQRIQIGDTPHIVVGVMPEGFRFPMNQRLWIPLRTNPPGDGRPGSSDAFIFARLVPGATLEGAHAEVTTVGLLPPEAAAGTTAQREPRVVPYAAGILPTVNRDSWLAGVIFLLGALLLMPPCANIAILVYARTVTRRDEFTVRTALGASRGRIVMQLFVEAIALRLHSSLPIAEAGGRSIPGIVPASAALMIVVGLLAVAGPARRAIRIDPTEALRVS